jgi:hypothetical protein
MMSCDRTIPNVFASIVFCIALGVSNVSQAADTPRSPPQTDKLAHDIFAELVGINSTHAQGSAAGVRRPPPPRSPPALRRRVFRLKTYSWEVLAPTR